jgi:DNA-binding winged helix-turn-helix (wHTH) protein
MDQILDSRLRFDRFTLDPMRAALRIGGEEVTLRPKTFDVLRYFAENPGRLVPKHELHEAVWPNVAVTDDSLVQCIRELRQVLGDEDHSLIKTVSRRGYLLDAEPSMAGRGDPLPGAAPARASLPLAVAWRSSAVLAAVVLLCVGAAVIVLRGSMTQPSLAREVAPPRVPAAALNKLFTARDAQRVADIAQRKALPLPAVEFDTPDGDVPAGVRNFVGVWVSDQGFVNTHRQFMFMVTHVEKQGLVGGWTVRGPPAENSRLQNPAEAIPIAAVITGGVLTYANPRGSYRVWFGEQGGLVFEQTYPTGHVTMVALDPVWTLLGAERVAAKSARR